MGAGQGKTNRTQARPSGLRHPPRMKRKHAPEFHREEWSGFVDAGDLHNVKFWRYYLGEGDIQAVPGNYEKIANELFRDAVTLGAITLPGKYKADDFQFR